MDRSSEIGRVFELPLASRVCVTGDLMAIVEMRGTADKRQRSACVAVIQTELPRRLGSQGLCSLTLPRAVGDLGLSQFDDRRIYSSGGGELQPSHQCWQTCLLKHPREAFSQEIVEKYVVPVSLQKQESLVPTFASPKEPC